MGMEAWGKSYGKQTKINESDWKKKKKNLPRKLGRLGPKGQICTFIYLSTYLPTYL